MCALTAVGVASDWKDEMEQLISRTERVEREGEVGVQNASTRKFAFRARTKWLYNRACCENHESKIACNSFIHLLTTMLPFSLLRVNVYLLLEAIGGHHRSLSETDHTTA